MSLIINQYKKFLIHRYDAKPHFKYFNEKDFPGLKKESFVIPTDKCNLSGGLYYYEKHSEEILIFVHGLESGHNSYFREIETLCKQGYRVFSFDITGCFSSEGESIISISQSIHDLKYVIEFVKENIPYSSMSLIGHSWGGYAVGNILHYFNDISSVVIISGFLDIPHAIDGFLINKKGIINTLVKSSIKKYEKKISGEFGILSLLNELNNTKTPVLYIQSIDDPIVPYMLSGKLIKEQCPNVRCYFFDNKGHNPNYSSEAVSYMRDAFSKLSLYKNQEELYNYLDSLDWIKMTNQDENVFALIFDFLSFVGKE